jgi:hypothetical protein
MWTTLIGADMRIPFHVIELGEPGHAQWAEHFAAEADLPADAPSRPWQVLAGGKRVKGRRGNPTLIDSLAPLAEHLPFQVGCGTSVENPPAIDPGDKEVA